MSLLSKGIINFQRISYQTLNIQLRNYAARKGTRERRQKKKVKVEEVKTSVVPKHLQHKEKTLAGRQSKKFDDSWKQTPTDNVYLHKYYKWPVYSFVEAVKCHRETHHPDIYNQPNAPLNLIIELNMEGEKKARFIDSFTRIASMPYKFDHGEERTILAFAKDSDLQKTAIEAGAALAGGTELIKQIQNGKVLLQNFKFYIAHPDIIPELVALRGLMKKTFPSVKSGTLSEDLTSLVTKFLNGISYTAHRDEYEKDFGSIETVIGTLEMDPKHLEENFVSLLKDLIDIRPKREGHFISRCLLMSPPSREKLKVDHNVYVNDVGKSKNVREMKVEEETIEAEAIAA